MARPREFDTVTAIESICEKFWADGYETTSITDLEGATGLARARLYAAFGSKRQMLHEALDFYLERRVDQLFRQVDNGGLASVASLFRVFARIANEQPARAATGCLVVNSVVELGREDPHVAARADRYRRRVRGAFRSALEKEAEDGRVAEDVETLADLAFMMLMGLFVSVKGGAPPEEITRLCAVAIHTVESWQVDHGRPAVKSVADTPLTGN